MEQDTTYEIKCPYCGFEFKLIMMLDINILKNIGHTVECAKCDRPISSIQNPQE